MQPHSSVDSVEDRQSPAQSSFNKIICRRNNVFLTLFLYIGQHDQMMRSNSSGLMAVHKMHQNMEHPPINPLKRTTGSVLADEMSTLIVEFTKLHTK
jgi:hypothetical protein